MSRQNMFEKVRDARKLTYTKRKAIHQNGVYYRMRPRQL